MRYLLVVLGLIVAAAIWYLARRQRSADTAIENEQSSQIRGRVTEASGGTGTDAAILPLLPILPDLLDYIQHRTEGNADKAALAMLALPPREMIAKLAPRVEAAAAIHGIEPLRRIANQIKTLPDCPQRSARIDELMKMIGDRAIDEQANEILTRLQNGQRPSAREAWFLEAAQKIYESREQE